MTDFSDMAKDIIESNRYMVLGTADGAGVPWVTPVWYAQSDYRRFIWVSSPDRRHSRNVRTRPEVSIVIFNSQVTEGSALAVYMSARAEELSGAELERDIAFFDTVSQVQGPTRRWAFEDISLRRPIDCIGRRCRSIGSSIQTAAPTPAPRSPCRAV
jgi:nitroimidazol reductase NimA-like FMN-containing flavoprotein (pyridoxamine 5'-phosphate oxidase superfamily)